MLYNFILKFKLTTKFIIYIILCLYILFLLFYNIYLYIDKNIFYELSVFNILKYSLAEFINFVFETFLLIKLEINPFFLNLAFIKMFHNTLINNFLTLIKIFFFMFLILFFFFFFFFNFLFFFSLPKSKIY